LLVIRIDGGELARERGAFGSVGADEKDEVCFARGVRRARASAILKNIAGRAGAKRAAEGRDGDGAKIHRRTPGSTAHGILLVSNGGDGDVLARNGGIG